MRLPKIKRMDEFDKAAWRGFLLGVGIAIMTLAPFVILAIWALVSGSATHHVHPPH